MMTDEQMAEMDRKYLKTLPQTFEESFWHAFSTAPFNEMRERVYQSYSEFFQRKFAMAIEAEPTPDGKKRLSALLANLLERKPK